MARQTFKSFRAASRYMFAKRFFGYQDTTPYESDYCYDNNKSLTWSDAADTYNTPVLLLDSDNVAAVDHERTKGDRQQIQFIANLNATVATTAFFIADRTTLITGIEYVHNTAGSDSGGLTAVVTHETGTQAAGTGTVIMTNTFNCQATANTVQNATLLAPTGVGTDNPGLSLAPGDRLSVIFTGVTTALAGAVITVSAAPGFKEQSATFAMVANGSLATQGFFLANRDMVITGVNLMYGVAGTGSGTVTIGVTHETSTTAPGSGNAVITALTAKGTANTVYSGVLSSTASYLKMLAGDRLSVVFTGTLTSLSNVIVVVYMQSSSDTIGTSVPYYGQNDINFHIATPATQAIWLADRDYEVVDVSSVFSTAGSGTQDVYIEKGTTAVGSGTSCLSGTMSATGSANTVVVGSLSTSRRVRLLSQGDRLTVVQGGTLGSLAGTDVTVSLLPR